VFDPTLSNAYKALTFHQVSRHVRKKSPSEPFYSSDFVKEFGAGEGIRTLDHNLGNVIGHLRQRFFFYATAR
jgi:hypothetical protein